MRKNLKARTEELLLYYLSSNEWIDDALYAYSNKLLNMMLEGSCSKELEAMARLISKYASYLDPAYCRPNFEHTQPDRLDGLTHIKQSLESTLASNYPGVPFTSRSRIKTLESFQEKIWRKGSTPSKAESDLKDLVAFRFILGGRKSAEYVQECYLFFETIIDSLVDEYGFIPIPGETKGTADSYNFDSEIVYIPKEIPADCKYIQHCKDYIRTPKENGYQGLQMSLYSSQRELYIEVQTKTLIMYENSEYFESSHDTVYKGSSGMVESRLFDKFDLRNLNNLHGFHSRDGKNFVDYLGLITPRSF